MIRGLYNSALGLMTERTLQHIMAHNLANVTTPGYREIQAAVRPYREAGVLRGDPTRGMVPIGSMNFGLYLDHSQSKPDIGALEETGRTFDVALRSPELFLAVEGTDRVYYTRRGALQWSADGVLVDSFGNPVIGRRGEIEVSDPDRAFIDEYGNVYEEDDFVDQLEFYRFDQPRFLERVSDVLYLPTEESGEAEQVIPRDEAVLQVGALEISNVDPTKMMVQMMEIMRRYEANMQMLRVADQTLGRAVNEIARLE